MKSETRNKSAPKAGCSAVLLAVANIERLSGSPVLLARALQILRDPNSDTAALIDLIATDPALTAGVIQLANSALYGARRTISTLPEAIHLLGYAEVYRSVGLHLSQAVLAMPLACYDLAAEDFWRNSVLAALCLQALAERGGFDPSEAYTVGLLHGIGRLAIDQGLRVTGLDHQFRADPLPWEEREPKYTRLTFAEVGGMLLEGWRFPQHLVEAVRCQLESYRAIDPPLVTALQLTRCTLRQAPPSIPCPDGHLAPTLQALRLSADEWKDICRRAGEQTAAIRQSMGAA